MEVTPSGAQNHIHHEDGGVNAHIETYNVAPEDPEYVEIVNPDGTISDVGQHIYQTVLATLLTIANQPYTLEWLNRKAVLLFGNALPLFVNAFLDLYEHGPAMMEAAMRGFMYSHQMLHAMRHLLQNLNGLQGAADVFVSHLLTVLQPLTNSGRRTATNELTYIEMHANAWRPDWLVESNTSTTERKPADLDGFYPTASANYGKTSFTATPKSITLSNGIVISQERWLMTDQQDFVLGFHVKVGSNAITYSGGVRCDLIRITWDDGHKWYFRSNEEGNDMMFLRDMFSADPSTVNTGVQLPRDEWITIEFRHKNDSSGDNTLTVSMFTEDGGITEIISDSPLFPLNNNHITEFSLYSPLGASDDASGITWGNWYIY